MIKQLIENNESTQLLKDYVSNQRQLYEVKLTRKLTTVITDLSYRMVLSVLSLALYMIFALSAIIWLSFFFDSWIYGSTVVAAFSLLLFVLFLIFGKSWIQKPIITSLLKSFRS